jgi:putative transposase
VHCGYDVCVRHWLAGQGTEFHSQSSRVLGEVHKLASQKISRQSVANIMREAGLDPGPERGEKTWDEFIKIHGATHWQCDFLTKKSWTLKGLRDLYLLVFLNVGTRRVYVAPATAHPNHEWVIEQTKAFVEYARREKLPVELVFHDADSKFGAAYDELTGHGLQPRRLQPRSPNLYAYVERWIQSIQVECLDHFIVFGEAHLDHLVAEYVAHFETERPHQGLDNKLVVVGRPPKQDVPLLGQVKCRERLGGLLKHFERRAAWGVAAGLVSVGRSAR